VIFLTIFQTTKIRYFFGKVELLKSSAWLDKSAVNKVSFSMAGKGHGQPSQFQHAWEGLD
jgi:hypothetical protein